MKMSKTKSKTAKGKDKVLSKVKNAGVAKPSMTPRGKGKEIAKKVAVETDKRLKKKAAPPEPESSEYTSEENAASSGGESESESEGQSEEKVSVAKPLTRVKDVESESESDSDAESSSESVSSGDGKPAKNGNKADGIESEGESDSESESESVTSTDGKPVKNGTKAESIQSEESDSELESGPEDAPTKVEKVAKKSSLEESEEESSEGENSEGASSDESSDDSSDVSDEEEIKEKEVAPKPQKRKTEGEDTSVAKKGKTEVAEGNSTATGNLFVGNLSWNVDEEWLRSEFEEFGELSGVRIVTERDSGRSRGFGYVEFTNADDAVKAHAAKKDANIDGRRVNLDFANARTSTNAVTKERAQSRAQSFGDQKSPESDTLFIGNIAFSATEDMIQETFSEHGSILGIRLPTDPDSGRPKGFGYIQFSSADEARSAIDNLQGADLAGRSMRLDFSTPRQNSGGFGGRGGSRGGGRGGSRGSPRGGSSRGGRGSYRGGRGGSTNRGGFGDFSGRKTTF